MQSGRGLYFICNVKHRNFVTLPDANSGTDLRGAHQDRSDHPEYIWEIIQHPNGAYDIRNNHFESFATWQEDTGPIQTVCGEDKTRITWRITPKDSYEYSISVSDKALFWSLDSGDSPVSLSPDDNDKSSWRIEPAGVPGKFEPNSPTPSVDGQWAPRIPDIAPLLNSLHYNTQIMGAKYLKTYAASDSKGATAMPNLLSALFRLLDAPDANVVNSAAEAVDAVAIHIRERNESLENKAIPALIQLLDYKNTDVQVSAANALRKIVSHPAKPRVEQTAVPVLVSFLNTGPVEVQIAACDALRNVSWDSDSHLGILQKKQVAEALQICLNSKEPQLQDSAFATLQCINLDISGDPIHSPNSFLKKEPDKLLQVRIVPYDIKVYDNDGTFLTATFFTYKPLLRDGWYYLGPSANGAGTQSLSYGPVVRELQEGMLADVVDWVCVWTNAKTTDKLKYSIWRGVPPTPEYIVLGHFFVRNWKKPVKHDLRGIKAVRRSVLVEAEAGRAVWDNSNYWFGQPASAWDVHEYGNAINPGVFVTNLKHTAPREGVYALDSARVEVID